MKALIVEDMPDIQRGIYAILNEMDKFEEILLASNLKEALDKVKKFKPKYVHLDINLTGNEGNKDGLELLKSLGKDTAVFIYTAMGSSYAMDVVNNPNILFKRYVLKEKGMLSKEQLISEIKALLNAYETSPIGRKEINLKEKSGIEVSISQQDFVFASANGKSCMVYTLSQTYEVKGVLSEILEKFDSPPVRRANRSHLVNINFYLKLDAKLLNIRDPKFAKERNIAMVVDITPAYQVFWDDCNSNL